MKNKINQLSNVRFKTQGIFIIAGVVLFGGAVIWKVIFKSPIPEPYLYFLLAISLIINSISSMYSIYYKEVPRSGNLPSIKGGWAVFLGSFSLVLSCISAIVLIFEAIQILSS
jgi:hypothetical protein